MTEEACVGWTASVPVPTELADDIAAMILDAGAIGVETVSNIYGTRWSESIPDDAWISPDKYAAGPTRIVATFPPDWEPDQIREAVRDSWHEPKLEAEHIEPLSSFDWVQHWKDTFEPLDVGPFHVRAPWHEPRTGAIDLLLEPGMAFGTGHHPTTRMCLDLLGQYPLDGLSVLDVGCGTGILSIAATKRGASPVVAVDVDDDAVRLARQAVIENGLDATAVSVSNDDLADVEGKFDIVVANILAPTLLSLRDELVAHCNETSILLLSGILVRESRTIIEAFEPLCGYEADATTEGEWTALTFAHPNLRPRDR